MAPETKYICMKCNCELVHDNVNLHYMGVQLSDRFLRCPICKQVFIPEETALGKMQEVETTLEDK